MGGLWFMVPLGLVIFPLAVHPLWCFCKDKHAPEAGSLLTKASPAGTLMERAGLRLKDLGLVPALTLTCRATMDMFPLFLHPHLKMKELDHP